MALKRSSVQFRLAPPTNLLKTQNYLASAREVPYLPRAGNKEKRPLSAQGAPRATRTAAPARSD